LSTLSFSSLTLFLCILFCIYWNTDQACWWSSLSRSVWGSTDRGCKICKCLYNTATTCSGSSLGFMFSRVWETRDSQELHVALFTRFGLCASASPFFTFHFRIISSSFSVLSFNSSFAFCLGSAEAARRCASVSDWRSFEYSLCAREERSRCERFGTFSSAVLLPLPSSSSSVASSSFPVPSIDYCTNVLQLRGIRLLCLRECTLNLIEREDPGTHCVLCSQIFAVPLVFAVWQSFIRHGSFMLKWDIVWGWVLQEVSLDFMMISLFSSSATAFYWFFFFHRVICLRLFWLFQSAWIWTKHGVIYDTFLLRIRVN
jgi:hypothetical protein